jgi:hypothetical protein
MLQTIPSDITYFFILKNIDNPNDLKNLRLINRQFYKEIYLILIQIRVFENIFTNRHNFIRRKYCINENCNPHYKTNFLIKNKQKEALNDIKVNYLNWDTDISRLLPQIIENGTNTGSQRNQYHNIFIPPSNNVTVKKTDCKNIFIIKRQMPYCFECMNKFSIVS